jgi:hypothetical protein
MPSSSMGFLRSAARRSLATVGLAPAGHVTALERQTRAAVEKARIDARESKARADELAEKAGRADRLAAQLAKAERRAERADRYRAELLEARERIERAEKAIALSREHLMATETKLDLVEAAIAALDRRTRG